jgi:galactarate dehydratase
LESLFNSGGLKKGDSLKNGIQLRENIPMGHKVALQNIGEGEKIIRYGQPIGFANCKFQPGEWVNASKIILPEAPI